MTTVERTITILDPTLAADATGTVSSRLQSLDGKTFGVIWNSRPPGDVIFEEIFNILRKRYTINDVIVRVKPYVGAMAPEPILDELEASCDAIVTGVGDCGSCTAASVLDAIEMERRGVPAAMVGAERLVRATGRGMARLQGLPDFPLGVIHGIGQMEGIHNDTDHDKIVGFAVALAPQIEGILLRGATD